MKVFNFTGQSDIAAALNYERIIDRLNKMRDSDCNKGTFGKVLIVAGRRNMCGAALLAAHACMTSGAGMVKIFTHEANRLIIQQLLSETSWEK